MSSASKAAPNLFFEYKFSRGNQATMLITNCFSEHQATGHNIHPNNVKVRINTIKRRVKEAISIKQRKPSLNRSRDMMRDWTCQ